MAYLSLALEMLKSLLDSLKRIALVGLGYFQGRTSASNESNREIVKDAKESQKLLQDIKSLPDDALNDIVLGDED